MTRKTATTWKKIDELAAEAERCLSELRTLPRRKKYAARRAYTQRRYAELGMEIRQLLGIHG